MQNKNWQKIQRENEERIKSLGRNFDIYNKPGIYILTRYENGFKHAYIGQAKKVLSRLAQHLSGHDQHIDKSIRKHGLKDMEHHGWSIKDIEYMDEKHLDNVEQYHIKRYGGDGGLGYQVLNKTTGGQGEGKMQLKPFKEPKKYRDGLLQGDKRTEKKFAKLLGLVEFHPIDGSVRAYNAAHKLLNFLIEFEHGNGKREVAIEDDN